MRGLKIKPLVSVVMTTYNRPEFIEEALHSVYSQQYDNIEILVVDDASDDKETVDILKKVTKTSPFPIQLMIQQKNRGPGEAREQGRKLANGAYIQYLDSDDLLLTDKIERQVAALESCPALDVAYGLTLVINENQTIKDALLARQVYRRSGESHDHLLPAILDGRLWGTVTPLYRTKLLKGVGPWLPLKVNEDIEYEFRVAALSGGLYYEADPVAMVRFHTKRLVDNILSGPQNLQDRILAHISIAKIIGNQARYEPYYFNHNLFWLNLFFLARKAASLNDKKSMDILMDAFLDAPGLPTKQAARAMAFRWFGFLFGAKAAGKISDYLEGIKWG